MAETFIRQTPLLPQGVTRRRQLRNAITYRKTHFYIVRSSVRYDNTCMGALRGDQHLHFPRRVVLENVLDSPAFPPFLSWSM